MSTSLAPTTARRPTHRHALVGAGSGLLVAVVGLLVEGARWLVGLPHTAPTFWDRWQSPALWVGACLVAGVAVSLARSRWRSAAAFFAGPAAAGAALGAIFLLLDQGAALVTGASAAKGILIGGTLGALGALWWRRAP